MKPPRGDARFVCMPGVRARVLESSGCVVLTHPRMPPALVDLLTGEIEELKIEEDTPIAMAVTLTNMVGSR